MSVASKVLDRLPLQYLPVRVRRGLARGARWTLYPHSAYWRGATEPDVEMAMGAFGSVAGLACWDLGAHFGIYTVGMARAVGPDGEVAAFEPDPEAHRRCQRHTRMNRLANVRLFNLAASDRTGPAWLIQDQGAGASTSHLRYEDEAEVAGVRRVEVPLVRLDDLVEGGRIRAPRFVKVDVEGHGAAALRGAARTIEASMPVIVMSFHSRWELEGTRDLLAPLGYGPWTCDGRRLGWDDALFRTALLRP